MTDTMPTGAARTGAGESRDPVFILSPMRSYSTVTVAVLAGHPEIYGFPELLIFSARTIGDILSAKVWSKASGRRLNVRLSGVCRTIAELHEGSQEQDAVERALRWLAERHNWPSTRFFDHLLCLIGPRIPVEKSPDTVMRDENLADCLEAYPNAKYIHLTRHPVTAQQSIMEQLARFDPSMSFPTRVASAASVWYLSHLRIARALQHLPRDRWLRLRGEDLLTEPRACLPVILDWLDLTYDQGVIDGMLRTERWSYAGTGPPGWLYGGDHKFMMSPELRPVPALEAIHFHPDLEMPDQMSARMTKLARYLGY
jgi:Sulfotransferase family